MKIHGAAASAKAMAIVPMMIAAMPVKSRAKIRV
jgi:hypothetical protein